MNGEWDDLHDWWLDELENDPAYEASVAPLLTAMLGTCKGLVIDVGCGTGRTMADLQSGGRFHVVGCDVNRSLLEHAAAHGPVAQVRLPDLPFAAASVDGAIVVLSFEHFEDDAFASLARIVRQGGHLVAVVNHPFITAPGAASVVDPTDGEVFWRPGQYLKSGSTVEEADGKSITFLHRSLGTLLTLAAEAGWALEELREEPFEPGGLPDAGLPRLIGVRWVRR